MSNDNTINDELTAAQELTAKLNKLAARQGKKEGTGLMAPQANQPVDDEEGWFSESLGWVGHKAAWVPKQLWGGYENARAILPLKFYEMFGPTSTAEDRNIRERMESTSVWDFTERKKINQDRPAMWMGEKIMTDIAFDPLSYIGFGLAGKIPMAGKYLGALEQGYITMVNKTVMGAVKSISKIGSFPIQLLAKASILGLDDAVKVGKIDDGTAKLITGGSFWANQSLGVKTSRIRDVTTEGVMSAIELISGLGAHNLDDPAVTAQAIKAVLGVSRGKLQEHGFDGAVILRDALETSHLSKRILENQNWVKEAANGMYGSSKLTPDMYQRVTDTVDAFLRGDNGFDHTVADLMSSLGLNHFRDDIVSNVSVWLTKAKLRQDAFVARISAMTPLEAAEFLGGQAAKRAGDDIVNGISALRYHQGMWGGFLSKTTGIYGAAWRGFIDKFMMRPMSEAVLASPAYPVGNLAEDVYYVVSGGAMPHMASVDEFNKLFQGVADPSMARLRKEGRLGIGTMHLGPLATEVTDKVDETGKVVGKASDFSYIPTKGKLAWFGRKWMDMSTKFSEMLKRGFWISRTERNLHKFSSQTAEADVLNNLPAYRNLIDDINAPPITGNPELAEEISQAVRMYAANGNVNAIRHILSKYTAPNIRKAQMLDELALYTDLSPVSRRIMRSAINSGDYDRITGVAIDHAIEQELKALSNTAGAQAEWFDNLIEALNSTELTNGADLTATMIGFNRAMSQTQSIMHSNMAATFEDVGTKFGIYEKTAFDKSYQNAKELSAVIDEKVPQVMAAYRKSAATLGVSVTESTSAFMKLQLFNEEFWAKDIAAHAGFFEAGGSALEWRITRQQLWGPMQEQYALAAEAAQEAVLLDVAQGAVNGPVDVYEVMRKLDTMPLSKAIQHPAGYNQIWDERHTSLQHMRTKLSKMADEVSITELEQNNLGEWSERIASQLDTAPRDTYPVLAKPKGNLRGYFQDEAGEPIVIYRGTTGGQDGDALSWGKGVLHATPSRELATTFGDNVQAFYVKGVQTPRAQPGAIPSFVDIETLGDVPRQSAVSYYSGYGKRGIDKILETKDFGGPVTIRGTHGTFLPDFLAKEEKFGGIHSGTRKAAGQRLDVHAERQRRQTLNRPDITEKNYVPTQTKLTKTIGTIDDPLSENDLFDLINGHRRRINPVTGIEERIPMRQMAMEDGVDGAIYYNIAEDPGSVSVLSFHAKNVSRARSEVPTGPFGKSAAMFDMDALASDIPDGLLTQMRNEIGFGFGDVDDLYDSAGLLFEAYAQRFGQAGALTALKNHGIKLLKQTDPLDEIGILDNAILEAIPGTSRGRTAVSSLRQPTELGQKFRADWDRAIESTKLESRVAFTDYDDQDGLDFAMKHIFPFWTYAKNIWPRLATSFAQHPVANSIAGPDGHYWQNTDNGYIPYLMGGVRIAAYRGLGVNRIINAQRKQFPSRQEGFLGKIDDEVVDRATTWGFYPGWPWSAGGQVVNSIWGDGSFEWGQQMPPLWQFMFESTLAAGTALDIPGTEKIYDKLNLGRFNEARERRAAFSMKLNPLDLSPEDKRRVIAKVSAFNSLNNAITMFQYRPEFYTEYKEARLEATALIANVDIEEIRDPEVRMKYFEENPLTPFQRQDIKTILVSTFGEISGEYMSVSEPYKSDKERAKSEAMRNYYDKHDIMKISHNVLQKDDDEGLDLGIIPSQLWRDNLSSRSQARRTMRESVMAVLGLTDEDMEKVNPSIVDLLIDDYYSVDLDNYRAEYTRYVNYNLVEEERKRKLEARLAGRPNAEAEMNEFLEYLYQNESERVQEFLIGSHKGFYSWFDTEDAIRWYAGNDITEANELLALNQRIEASDVDQRVAIASGQSRRLVTSIGRVVGDWRIAMVMKKYRSHLLEQDPEIEGWLRKFYEIIP